MVKEQSPEINLWRQCVGYGAADFACNLIWKMSALYLLYFYTDVMEIPTVQVGLLFILARLIDGVSDIAMGVVIDRTRTRWGKARPYFIFGAIPLAVFSILTFYVPDTLTKLKFIYALITYIGLSISYTVVNVPLTAILPMMSNDNYERTLLATSRNIFASLGGTIVAGFTPFLIEHLDPNSKAHSFFLTMCIYSVAAFLIIHLLDEYWKIRNRVAEKHLEKECLESFGPSARLGDNLHPLDSKLSKSVDNLATAFGLLKGKLMEWREMK